MSASRLNSSLFLFSSSLAMHSLTTDTENSYSSIISVFFGNTPLVRSIPRSRAGGHGVEGTSNDSLGKRCVFNSIAVIAGTVIPV